MSPKNLQDDRGDAIQTTTPENRCSICNNKLPSNAFFCKYCDPPLAPDPVPDSVLGFRQTLLQILLVIILFVGVIISKLDITLDLILPNQPSDEDGTPLKELSVDPDFKVIHFVNVKRANVRLKPSLTGKILMILKKNEEVIILESRDKWTQIKAYGKIGWIGSRLLDSKVQ